MLIDPARISNSIETKVSIIDTELGSYRSVFMAKGKNQASKIIEEIYSRKPDSVIVDNAGLGRALFEQLVEIFKLLKFEIDLNGVRYHEPVFIDSLK